MLTLDGLRMAVNNELGDLDSLLRCIPEFMQKGPT